MLSVVIPTKNAQESLPALFESLKPARDAGLVSEVIASDANSTDATVKILEEHGARTLTGVEGRGFQLVRAAAAAQGAWLLFLRPHTTLEQGWHDAAKTVMENNPKAVGYFRMKVADDDAHPVFEFWAGLRASLFKLPLGDQGLLISKECYSEAGGFRPDFPDLEDLDLIKRVKRSEIVEVPADIFVDAAPYKERGWFDTILDDMGLTFSITTGKKPIEVLKTRHDAEKRKEKAAAAAAAKEKQAGGS